MEPRKDNIGPGRERPGACIQHFPGQSNGAIVLEAKTQTENILLVLGNALGGDPAISNAPLKQRIVKLLTERT